MRLHASFILAFSLVALVPAFGDCCVFIYTHKHGRTYTPLSLQSKLGIRCLLCEGEIGSVECLGGLPVWFQCVRLCAPVVLCVCCVFDGLRRL